MWRISRLVMILMITIIITTTEITGANAKLMSSTSTTATATSGRQYPGFGFGYPNLGGVNGGGGGGGGVGGSCPLCDGSVYSYCSHKMIHDACCCDFPGGARPTQCGYYDCSLLYAKSCYEHALIKNCCCNNPY